jgi:hypothetical protein
MLPSLKAFAVPNWRTGLDDDELGRNPIALAVAPRIDRLQAGRADRQRVWLPEAKE